MTAEAKIERRNKILKGLEKAYEKMLVFKKERKSELVIIQDNKIVKIKLDEILYIEGLKDYVMIFIPGQRIITLQTMKNLEQRLPSGKFIRVHRSFIISIDKLISVASHSVEIGDKQIPIGKNYKEAFMKLMEQQNYVK